MTDHREPRVDDGAIRAMLAARAERLRPAPLDVAALIAEAGAARWTRPSRFVMLLPRLGMAGATVLVLVVGSAIVVGPRIDRPVGSTVPSALSAGPSAAAPASPSPTLAAADGAWPGGIPRSVDGQPVLIGLAAQQQADLATDATPFLAGGWFSPNAQVCSGGIGPRDPNPLEQRGCARYAVGGIPGIPFYPPSLVVPAIDTPVVFRAHVRDPGAETCWDVVTCRKRLVIDAIVWAGDGTTRAAPIGPSQAMGIAAGIAFADNRVQPDATYYVDEDLFALAAACPAPWPTLTFRVRGDLRLVAVAAFPDVATREQVQAALNPSAALACFVDGTARIGEPRWIARENVLLLVSSDAATAEAIGRNLPLTPGGAGWRPIPLPGPELDRSVETLTDYLTARSAGEIDHAAADRLILPEVAAIDRYASFQADTLRRLAADALAGTISVVADQPSRGDLEKELPGPLPANAELHVFRVDYPGATDPALASETYLVIHDPTSTFADWQLLRIGGAPYPQIPVREPVAPPPGIVPSVEPVPGGSGSGDTPCLPAGQECG